MTATPLHLSYDESLDWLQAPPFGAVLDRQGPERWRGVGERFGFFIDDPGGQVVGFMVKEFSRFDPEDGDYEETFRGPRFDVPALALEAATAGEVVLAAVPFLQGTSTIDRVMFVNAMNSEGEEALARAALEIGEPGEARMCCAQALELEEVTGEETDADELIAELDRLT